MRAPLRGLLAITALALSPVPAAALQRDLLDGLPLAFVENGGQMDEEARFVCPQGDLTSWFTDDSIRCVVTAPDGSASASVFFTFPDALPTVRLVAEDPLDGAFHVLRGDRSLRGLRRFGALRYRGLLPGVDVEVHGRGGPLEYDLLLDAGVDLASIRIRCEGGPFRIAEDGRLVVSTPAGELVQGAPVTFEVAEDGSREPVASRFRRIDEHHFGFEAPERDPSRPLVVDPTLTYSTFLGAAVCDRGLNVTIDDQGCVYVVGSTNSPAFPTVPGAFDTTVSGFDVFVTKLSPGGDALEFSTVLGGSGDDGWELPSAPELSPFYGPSHGIELGPDGSVYVAAHTGSADFPVTPGAADTSYGGGFDAFVARLSADGSSLLYSTFVGGVGLDITSSLAVDAQGRAHLAGSTDSPDLATTAGALQATPGGGGDAFFARLDAAGSAFEMLTYLGSSGLETGPSMDVDAAGRIVLSLDSEGAGLPTTAGSFQPAPAGGVDVFVGELDPSGSSLLWSTWLGGSLDDRAGAVRWHPSGDVLVGGTTLSRDDFPTTPGAAVGVPFAAAGLFGEFAARMFVARLRGDGSDQEYNTLLELDDASSTATVDQFDGLDVDDFGRTFAVGRHTGGTIIFAAGAFHVVRVADDGGEVSSVQTIPSSLTPGDDFLGGVRVTIDVHPTIGRLALVGTSGPAWMTTPGVVGPAFLGGQDGDSVVRVWDYCPGPLAFVDDQLPACDEPLDPVLSMTPIVIGEPFSISVTSAFPNAPGWLVLSAEPVPGAPLTFPGNACRVWVDLSAPPHNLVVVPFPTTDGDGSWTLNGLVTNPVLVGPTYVIQARLCVPDGPVGPVTPDWISNGVRFRIGCP